MTKEESECDFRKCGSDQNLDNANFHKSFNIPFGFISKLHVSNLILFIHATDIG